MSSGLRNRALPDALDLEVGATVVYGAHGIGRVSSRGAKGRGSGRTETVVLEFPSGLAIILPLERAEACLRPLASIHELDEVRTALRVRDVPIEQSWQIRSRATRTKISAGHTIGLAEVVRDANERQRRSTGKTPLSPAEHELYTKARQLLTAELGAVAGLAPAAADAWIDHQLER
jgi:RNA polymerase-interacting CarD/CdnL/TRCF family regulator